MIIPEVVAVADALLEAVMAQLVWADSGGERPRALPADGQFCRRLGERLGREWLGPLIAWMGTVIRLRRRPGGWPGVRAVRRGPVVGTPRTPAIDDGRRKAGLVQREEDAGPGTNWRAVVPAEQRFVITSLLGEAEEQLQRCRGGRHMLEDLSRGTGLLDQVLLRVTVAAVNAAVPLEEVDRWVRLSEAEAVKVLGTYRDTDGE
ncbi:hypothetical protein [Streptomyces alboflavus]|uniref:hypothetical protein n=1 Tax=Streptomyces alboflavus TaxID=67267 RepID=UPI001F3419FF|nr:hypothetical protein [Streptomyces alboflavus]